MAVDQEEMREAAEAVLGEQAPAPTCAECGQEFKNEVGLKLHMRKHGGQGGKAEASRTVKKGPPSQAVLDQVAQKFEKNLEMIGLMGAALAPHTGLTIHHRAAVITQVAIERAKKDARVLEVMVRVNQFFEGSQAGTVVASVGVAAAIDFGVMDAHARFQLGPMQLAPGEMLIGDVIEEVDQARAQLAAQQEGYLREEAAKLETEPNGHRSRRRNAVETVEGGVEQT